MIDKLTADFSIDTNRVYIGGGSEGVHAVWGLVCEGSRVVMPYEGGTEFFSHKLFDEAVCIARSVCRINGFQTIPFVRERQEDPIDETGLIVEAFANKVRARRLELNLRQTDVARLAGVARRTIERIERDGQANFHNRVAVLRALNLEYLFA